jgi:hypothetical protein
MHRLLHNKVSDLELLGQKHNTGKCHYQYLTQFDIYFSKIRSQPVRLLELGLLDGASLKVWEEYFPNATFVGVDIDDRCLEYKTNRTDIIIGNLDDEKFIQSLKTLGPFDIIIDDAGHTMSQQITLFKALFPVVQDQGVYIIEDLHTSYWPVFNGNIEGKNTTMSFLKECTDHLNHQAFKKNSHDKTYEVHCPGYIDEDPNYLDLNIYSIQFYKSMCAILKGDAHA